MKRINMVVWGLVLIAAGLLIALNALNITNINLFFDGWWTLIITIPCAVGLFTEREKTGNLIGLCIGILLLLCCQNILSFALLGKLIVPVIILGIGIKMLFKGLSRNKAREVLEQQRNSGKQAIIGCATFSSCNLHCDGEVFEGAELTAVFGGVKLDLRKAIIPQDCATTVFAAFGGIDILVPENINVKVNSTCLFGGISNKTAVQKSSPTLYISGTCMFGGVEVK